MGLLYHQIKKTQVLFNKKSRRLFTSGTFPIFLSVFLLGAIDYTVASAVVSRASSTGAGDTETSMAGVVTDLAFGLRTRFGAGVAGVFTSCRNVARGTRFIGVLHRSARYFTPVP